MKKLLLVIVVVLGVSAIISSYVYANTDTTAPSTTTTIVDVGEPPTLSPSTTTTIVTEIPHLPPTGSDVRVFYIFAGILTGFAIFGLIVSSTGRSR